MTLPTTPLTPAQLPAPDAPAIRTDLFSLSTGVITITWPTDLGDATPEDVAAWLNLMSTKIGKVAKGKAPVSAIPDHAAPGAGHQAKR